MKWSFYNFTSVLLLLQIISGCASTNPLPGSEKVKVMGAPTSNCKNLGQISDNILSRSDDLEDSKHKTNIVLLKNQAFQLGANVIVITDHSVNKENRFQRMGKQVLTKRMNNHAMVAIAYDCKK